MYTDDLLGNHHKLIMDPVHGGIPLSKNEVDVVDHPLFQRLRYICQNDILSLVFPGATHSRFLHSVGAMHVGGRMFKALVANALRQTKGPSELSTQQIEAVAYFSKLLRCACLLHDAGHSSFSHQFSRSEKIRQLLSQAARFDKLWENTQNQYQAPQDGCLEHEHYSVRVAHEILNATKGDGPQARDVISLMETSSTEPSEEFANNAKRIKELFCRENADIISDHEFAEGLHETLASLVSGELDADRADYMLRDGFHSSVTIGGFNLDHLLSNLRFGLCPQTGWMGLAISEKGLGSLEDFVYSRYQMYRQVYAHKTAQGFDWLLRAAIDEVMAQEDVAEYVDTCLSDINEFQSLTDNYFWEAFRRFSKDNPKSYSYCILNRIRMKHVATRFNLGEYELHTYRDFLASEHGYDPKQLVCSDFTARFTKIRQGFDGIKIQTKSHQSGEESYELISNRSQFFAKFSDDRITHFYLDPTV